MHSLGPAILAALPLHWPAGTTPHLQLLLRWVHFVAGIAWVGLLYFFVLVNGPFLAGADASTRMKVVPQLMPRAMWWFRWASVVTVLAGIWYWMMVVHADAGNAQTSGSRAIGTFFALWTLAFAVEMGLLMAPAGFLRKGPVFGLAMTVVVLATAWLYLALNSHGWESNRLLAIGIGGGMGWFMMLNVWGIVWRAQKKIIRWTAESAAGSAPMPAQAAQLARISRLAAYANFVLSFPMLLMMAVASHYPVFRP
jgi:uncharacterized membrane protein